MFCSLPIRLSSTHEHDSIELGSATYMLASKPIIYEATKKQRQHLVIFNIIHSVTFSYIQYV